MTLSLIPTTTSSQEDNISSNNQMISNENESWNHSSLSNDKTDLNLDPLIITMIHAFGIAMVDLPLRKFTRLPVIPALQRPFDNECAILLLSVRVYSSITMECDDLLNTIRDGMEETENAKSLISELENESIMMSRLWLKGLDTPKITKALQKVSQTIQSVSQEDVQIRTNLIDARLKCNSKRQEHESLLETLRKTRKPTYTDYNTFLKHVDTLDTELQEAKSLISSLSEDVKLRFENSHRKKNYGIPALLYVIQCEWIRVTLSWFPQLQTVGCTPEMLNRYIGDLKSPRQVQWQVVIKNRVLTLQSYFIRFMRVTKHFIVKNEELSVSSNARQDMVERASILYIKVAHRLNMAWPGIVNLTNHVLTSNPVEDAEKLHFWIVSCAVKLSTQSYVIAHFVNTLSLFWNYIAFWKWNSIANTESLFGLWVQSQLHRLALASGDSKLYGDLLPELDFVSEGYLYNPYLVFMAISKNQHEFAEIMADSFWTADAKRVQHKIRSHYAAKYELHELLTLLQFDPSVAGNLSSVISSINSWLMRRNMDFHLMSPKVQTLFIDICREMTIPSNVQSVLGPEVISALDGNPDLEELNNIIPLK